jgi:hypothetical protein
MENMGVIMDILQLGGKKARHLNTMEKYYTYI